MNDYILITGINGFIGSHIGKSLAESGRHVLGLSIESECSIKSNLITYECADITDEQQMKAVFSKYPIKTVIHLAAIVHKKGNDLSYDSYLKVNYKASEFIFKCAIDHGAKDILFASTIEVYGSGSPSSVIQEDDKLFPESDYGKTKMMAEQSLISIFNGTFRYAIMRFAPVYDRDFRLNINKRIYLRYPRFAYYFKKGDYSFHFCSIHNIIDFVNQWIKEGKNGIFNIADAQPVAAKEMISFEKRTGRASITLRMPFFLCYGLIWLVEKVQKTLGKQDSMLSVYNFNKLFQSTYWDNQAMQDLTGTPKWNMNNTIYNSVED